MSAAALSELGVFTTPSCWNSMSPTWCSDSTSCRSCFSNCRPSSWSPTTCCPSHPTLSRRSPCSTSLACFSSWYPCPCSGLCPFLCPCCSCPCLCSSLCLQLCPCCCLRPSPQAGLAHPQCTPRCCMEADRLSSWLPDSACGQLECSSFSKPCESRPAVWEKPSASLSACLPPLKRFLQT